MNQGSPRSRDPHGSEPWIRTTEKGPPQSRNMEQGPQLRMTTEQGTPGSRVLSRNMEQDHGAGTTTELDHGAGTLWSMGLIRGRAATITIHRAACVRKPPSHGKEPPSPPPGLHPQDARLLPWSLLQLRKGMERMHQAQRHRPCRKAGISHIPGIPTAAAAQGLWQGRQKGGVISCAHWQLPAFLACN